MHYIYTVNSLNNGLPKSGQPLHSLSTAVAFSGTKRLQYSSNSFIASDERPPPNSQQRPGIIILEQSK